MATQSNAYTGVAKTLHWVMALIIIVMLIFGEGLEDSKGEELTKGLAAHSSLGLIVLALVLLRILWRFGHPPPALPEAMGTAQKIAAHAVHAAIYVLMIYLPLTGLYAAAVHDVPVTPFGAFDVREALSFLGVGSFDARRPLHAIGTKVMLALVVLHIGAALYHQFVQRDAVLRRMLPWVKP